MSDVIVVGAGLAGLTCARRLQAAGVSCVVIDAAGAPGGRVRTDLDQGYALDRGFQVLLTAYPEAKRWLDYASLDLRPYKPGALVQLEAGRCVVADPVRQPAQLISTLGAPVGPLADKLRIATFRSRCRRGKLANVFTRPETTAMAALANHGFGPELTERFLRPWLGGIFLDPALETSSRMLEFVFRMFAEGQAAVPAGGMGQIPKQLAAGLTPDSLRLETRVASITCEGVVLTTGEVVQAKHVVVATDGTAAAGLLPGVAAPAWRPVTCLYFAADRTPIEGPWLVLNGRGKGRVNNVVVPSELSERFAPAGESLISVSVLGLPDKSDGLFAADIRDELIGWFGEQVKRWRWVRTYRLPQALPVRSPLVIEPPRALSPGRWVCGDHRSSASIHGAMESGRSVAEAILLTA